MQDKGVNDGVDSGADTGAFEEAAEALHGSEPKQALNRNELMQKTGKELAKMAAPYSELQLNTLERKSKAELCDIILNRGSEAKEEKTHARAGRTESQTEQFITGLLMALDVMKQNRDGEPLHPVAKQIFNKQAIVYADEKIKKDELDVNKANNFLLYGVGAFLLFDAVVGVKNSPALLAKAKNLFQKRKKGDTSDSK